MILMDINFDTTGGNDGSIEYFRHVEKSPSITGTG
jgi:hypothetical protein